MPVLASSVFTPRGITSSTSRAGRFCNGARVAACARRRVPAFAGTHGLAATQLADTDELKSKLSDVLSGQLTLGSVLGFATGYSVRRVGQLVLIVIGIEVVALQLMAKRGWLVMDWSAIGHDLSPRHLGKDGFERFMNTVKFRVPFAGAFSTGVYAGLRWS
jgi:uncharacterized membrane protein (Fun14 family)